MALSDYGWNESIARSFEPWAATPGLEPGRVVIEFNHLYRVAVETGDLEAMLSGRVKHHASSRSELPAVGDWVVVRRESGQPRGAIVAVLPRRSRFSRKVAGHVTDEQVVAANADVLFIVMALDTDFSLRRLERYLLLARESGASPVVLLTKPDLATSPDGQAAAARTVAGGAPVHVINPRASEGLDQVSSYLQRGVTSALVGSSGVGKSTIINRLAGRDVQRTREVRESDAKGRHTTTHRQLVILPDGGLIIDTPGMRELQLWDVRSAVPETFDDITAVAGACHFTDCRHRDEPRCAVKAAVAEGRVPAARLESYLKLQDELAALERQQEERERHPRGRRGGSSDPPAKGARGRRGGSSDAPAKSKSR